MKGEKLREIRRSKNISQARLAEMVGVTQQAVGKWEKNKAEPDNDMLIQLANIFGVSVDVLLGAVPVALHADTERRTGEARLASILRTLQGKINAAFNEAIRAAEADADEITPEERAIYEKVRRADERRIKKDYGKSTTA